MASSSSTSKPADGLKDAMDAAPTKDKLSTLVLLTRSDLERYYKYFQKAGLKMIDSNAHLTDMQVEQMLVEVERSNEITFNPDIRVQLWKALRYQWFRGPGHNVTYVDRSKVPDLFLPKSDYKEVDWNVRMADIDPDRQRQFIRKVRPSNEPAFRGPAVSTLQFEIWKRQNDVVYEFKDIERSIAEWQMRNPKTMLREDPREEVMKLRIRSVEDVLTGSLIALRTATPIWCRWWRSNPLSVKLQRLLYKCQWQVESISDFRVETEHERMDPSEDFQNKFVFKKTPGGKEGKGKKKGKGKSRDLDLGGGRKSKKKSKKNKLNAQDESVSLWTGNKEEAKKNDDMADEGAPLTAEDHVAAIQRSLAESFKRLPHIPIDLRHRGGNRMKGFAGKMGMPAGHEENLRVRLPRVAEGPDAGREPPEVFEGDRPLPREPSLPSPPSAPSKTSLPESVSGQSRSSGEGRSRSRGS